MATGQPTPSFLSDTERAVCDTIVQLNSGVDSQRAKALLLVDSGVSHREAGEQCGLTMGQVRYALVRYRKMGLAIFPPQPALEQPKEEQMKKSKKVKSESKVKKDKKKKKDCKKAKCKSKVKKDKKKKKECKKTKCKSKVKKDKKKGKKKK